MQAIAFVELVAFLLAVVAISATVGLIFGGATAVLIKVGGLRRRILFAATTALPLALWALPTSAFGLHWLTTRQSNVPGFCWLPNDYGLMIGQPDTPGAVFKWGSQAWGTDAIDGVRTLQVAGRYILGSRDSHGFVAKPTGGIDSYFLLDTATGTVETLPTFQQLETSARALGISPKLENFYEVYSTNGMPTIRVDRVGVILLFPILGWLIPRWRARIRQFNFEPVTNTSPVACGQ